MPTAQLLILGKGEIARCLAHIAHAATYPVSICEPGLQPQDWPVNAKLVEKIYPHTPWTLPANTHAVIARGHEADAQSIAALLNHGAAHVYLIASARRAQAVMQEAQVMLQDPLGLERLSAPAGLALGGRASADIALSILAEIQWRLHGGALLPMRELRADKAAKSPSSTHEDGCPGQRG